jgi:hypothetical protein
MPVARSFSRFKLPKGAATEPINAPRGQRDSSRTTRCHPWGVSLFNWPSFVFSALV